MIRDKNGGTIKDTYGSVAELIDAGRQYRGKVDQDLSAMGTDVGTWAMGKDYRPKSGETTWDVCERLAQGWEDGLAVAMPILTHALQTVEQTVDLPTFEAEWMVAGAEVDIARYLSGQPECMIEYSPVTVSRAGRVVTLVASVAASAVVSPESILTRGAAVVALAMALEQCQHSTEIWVDQTITGTGSGTGTIRVLVKSAADSIDPAVLAYWLAHPSILRQHVFAAENDWPRAYRDQYRIGTTYGTPTEPVHDIPDAIYLPAMKSSRDVPDADTWVIERLTELGLVQAREGA